MGFDKGEVLFFGERKKSLWFSVLGRNLKNVCLFGVGIEEYVYTGYNLVSILKYFYRFNWERWGR